MNETQTRNLYTDDAGLLLARSWRLAVVAGPDEGRSIDIGAGTVLVGTSVRCDLALTDPTVSRYHVEVRPCAAGLELTDLDSTNGTFVGSLRLGSVVVRDSAQCRIGRNTVLAIEPVSHAVATESYADDHFGSALGASARMRRLFGVLARVAPVGSTLLLEGESGTGKDLLADAVHRSSPRADGPFISIDCISNAEIEGLHRDAFVAADGGTLVLDEIAAIPLEVQPQLLRAIEKREVRRVGEVQTTKVDTRIIALTDRDLRTLVRAGSFREDLYFRLAVVRAVVPPLRERREDIPLLARHALALLDHADFSLSPDVLAALMAYEWPGNVRELLNVIARVVSLDRDVPDAIVRRDVGTTTLRGYVAPQTPALRIPAVLGMGFKTGKETLMRVFEREYVTHLLRSHDGNVTRAAVRAQIDRNHLRRLARKYGIAASDA
jgi:DNA-binding NtrC family response regulator